MSYCIAMLSVHTSPLAEPGRTKDAGGMNVYIRQLAQALAQYGATIDIFTRRVDQHTPTIVQLTPHVRVIHLKAGPLTSLHKDELYQHLPEFISNIEKFRCKHKRTYDVLHSHYWLSGIAAEQLAQQWDIPHVIMFHTLGYLKQLANPNAPEPKRRLEMEQQLIHQVDRIVVATNDERTQVINTYKVSPHQIEVIPCGVDLQLFKPREKHRARKQLGLPLQRPVVLFAGRLDPFKGPDILLRAAALMEEDAQIVLVGGKLVGDPELQALRALAQKLGIAHRTHFSGAVAQQRLVAFYNAADITAVPSYHESFGMVAVESLACGTPIVATHAGGLTTIIRSGENGYLVPRCPGFFAERLDMLIRTPELYSKISQASRPSIRQFSWENIALQVHQLYEDLAGTVPYLVAQ